MAMKETDKSHQTQSLILETALRLFNEQGVEQVTVRHIAREIGISHGNLCYHFPNTDAIVDRLYRDLVALLDSSFEAMLETPEISIVFLRTYARVTIGMLHHYRFLMIDFVGIMRKHEAIRTHFRHLQKLRSHQFHAIFDLLVASSIMRPEILPGQFEYLKQQLSIIGDFWISSAEILYEGPAQEKLDHYLDLFMHMLPPYLTDRGLAEFKALKG
jgi:AcrR family transcriptional regulator